MFGLIVIRQKRLDEIIADAVGKATGLGYNAGFLQAIIEVNNILLKCGAFIERVPPTQSLVEKQIEIILQRKEEMEGGL